MGEFQFPIINERIIPPPTRSSMDRTSTSVTTALTALYPNLLVALTGGLPRNKKIFSNLYSTRFLPVMHYIRNNAIFKFLKELISLIGKITIFIPFKANSSRDLRGFRYEHTLPNGRVGSTPRPLSLLPSVEPPSYSFLTRKSIFDPR
jgi:hypothetical protein